MWSILAIVYAMLSYGMILQKSHGFLPSHHHRSFLKLKSHHMLSYHRLLSTSLSYSSTRLPILLDKTVWDASTRCVILESPSKEPVKSHGNHPDEVEYISQVTQPSAMSSSGKSSKRYNTFLGGRQALRQSFASLNYSLDTAVLKDEYGAPVVLPSSIKGTISHKDSYVVGLASLIDRGRVGVDLERCTNKAVDQLQRRLLTSTEIASLGSLASSGISIEEEVLLRFSVKESVHKALHPQILRPIGFQEVEVYPHANGDAEINFLLSIDKQIKYEAYWERFLSSYWLTAVRIWLH
jgi:phosphopantetheine--protein transferase-like protein